MVQFIHIGIHKTASTWLQNVFFHLHPNLAVLGSNLGDETIQKNYIKEVRRLVLGSDLTCDTTTFAKNVSNLCQEYKTLKCNNNSQVTISGISHEAFSGDWPTGKNSRFIAQTLAHSFPKAKIILFIREQRSMLVSSYRQYIRIGGTATFLQFLLDPHVSEGFIDDDSPKNTHIIEFFKYSRIVKLYQDLFGVENVYVGCMEQLRREPQTLVDDLTDFLEIEKFIVPKTETNIQLSNASLSILRWLNYFFYTRHHRRYGFMPIVEILYVVLANYNKATWRKVQSNPYLAKKMVSGRIRNIIADKILPKLDLLFLKQLSLKKSFSFKSLPNDFQNWLINEYCKDNDILQRLIKQDLKNYGYTVSD